MDSAGSSATIETCPLIPAANSSRVVLQLPLFLMYSPSVVWPPEMLIIFLLCATTIAFDLVCFTVFQARKRVESSVFVGCFFVTVFRPLSFNLAWSGKDSMGTMLLYLNQKKEIKS